MTGRLKDNRARRNDHAAADRRLPSLAPTPATRGIR